MAIALTAFICKPHHKALRLTRLSGIMWHIHFALGNDTGRGPNVDQGEGARA